MIDILTYVKNTLSDKEVQEAVGQALLSMCGIEKTAAKKGWHMTQRK